MSNSKPTTPRLPPLKPLRFTFPMRKKGHGNNASAVEIIDEHEFHRLLKNEPSGGYSVSRSGMWHGGIHISEAGAGQFLDIRHGVRCIADGEVVAWRLNKAYPVSEFPAGDDNPVVNAPYSTGFALVRHAMEFPRGTTLTFFSLYMHLQDLRGYEDDTRLPRPAYWSPEFKVTTFARDKPSRSTHGQPGPAEQQGLRVRATRAYGRPLCILPQGTQFSISERAGNWGKIKNIHEARPYPPKAGAFAAPTAAIGGWVFLGKEHGGHVVEEVMPEDHLDKVVVPTPPVKIKAGELIGYLGRYDSLNQKTSSRMTHVEVFCGDDIKSFLAKGREWIAEKSTYPKEWKALGLPAEPTILRVGKGTKLYKAALHEGKDAPRTDVIVVEKFSELSRNSENRYAELAPGTDNLKLNWWKVGGANMLRNPISGSVREQNFAGGRVTREFPQSWIDFDTLEHAHDPTHTLFAATHSYVDYVTGADVPESAALSKLSPLMTAIYRAIYAGHDDRRAADELCCVANDPWRALTMSRLIIKHESEWANPAKWKRLVEALGEARQHEAEQKRIEDLVWWDDVKAVLSDLPGPEVFHIHPFALVGNFIRQRQLITLDMLVAAEPGNSDEYNDDILPHLNKYAEIYNVNTPKRIAHFLSQAAHESGFRIREEALNYGARLMRKTFGCRGGPKQYDKVADECVNGRLREKLWSQELQYAHNAINLGSYVYADRMGNGDESTGDGYKYRGRGIIQVTGKSGYQSFQDEHNRRFPEDSQNFVENPGLLSANLGYGIESGFVFWVKSNLNSIAEVGSVRRVTQVVNGGWNGYGDRRNRYNRVAPLLGLPADQ